MDYENDCPVHGPALPAPHEPPAKWMMYRLEAWAWWVRETQQAHLTEPIIAALVRPGPVPTIRLGTGFLRAPLDDFLSVAAPRDQWKELRKHAHAIITGEIEPKVFTPVHGEGLKGSIKP